MEKEGDRKAHIVENTWERGFRVSRGVTGYHWLQSNCFLVFFFCVRRADHKSEWEASVYKLMTGTIITVPRDVSTTSSDFEEETLWVTMMSIMMVTLFIPHPISISFRLPHVLLHVLRRQHITDFGRSAVITVGMNLRVHESLLLWFEARISSGFTAPVVLPQLLLPSFQIVLTTVYVNSVEHKHVVVIHSNASDGERYW